LSSISNELRNAVLGLAFVTVGLALGAAAAGERTLPLDAAIMSAIQQPQWAGFDRLAWAASRLGDFVPWMLLISLGGAASCASRGREDLAVFLLAATALRILGTPLKWLFASPRPPLERAATFEMVSGLGFPSGHAFGAALMFGALAIVSWQLIRDPLWRRIVAAGLIALMLLIAVARVRLGVHWPSDAAGGLAFGLGFVLLLLAPLTRLRRPPPSNCAS
jgi:membrane-associated phospholipid phosphatase